MHFCNGFLLFAKLRKSNIDGAQGTKEALEMLVSEIRKKWPDTKIIFRADSGFARNEIMNFCEKNNIEYIISLPKNSRLVKMINKKSEVLKKKDVLGLS